jgi:hypothetical protein
MAPCIDSGGGEEEDETADLWVTLASLGEAPNGGIGRRPWQRSRVHAGRRNRGRGEEQAREGGSGTAAGGLILA